MSSILGHPVRRVEDQGMITGVTRYLDDVGIEGALHAVFVRSITAHARIGGIDPSGAAAPGVVGVFTGEDLSLPPLTSSWVPETFARPMLADGVVRFAGEAVAVVVAESLAQAVDAAENVLVDYDFLPAVTDVTAAMDAGAPLLFPEHGSNIALDEDYGTTPVELDSADVVVDCRFVNQRLAPVPMETNGCIAVPEGDRLTMWVPSQAPNSVRDDAAEILGLRPEGLRVRSGAIGGGFGAKIPLYPEYVVIAAIARRLGRPVGWIEARSENMLAMTHGRGQIQSLSMAARSDGTITGLKVDVLADAGAYPGDSAEMPELTWKMAAGVYRIPEIEFRTRYIATNATPTYAYRGAGRPEATTMLERAVDMLARKLDMDPVELRRKNLIPPDDFPYRPPSGITYDTGEYEKVLDEVLRLSGYEELRAEQARRRESGAPVQLGIGLSCYVEITGWGTEYGSVRVGEDGSVTVLTGTASTGQGHLTAWSQLVSGILGVPMEKIRVVQSDTDVIPRGDGTMGSRSVQMGGSALLIAAETVRAKGKDVAANLLEVAPEDLEQSDGGAFSIVGAPDRVATWPDIARAASAEAVDLTHATDFGDDQNTFPFGAHVAVVEVDTETGAVRLVRHVAVDDCGRILNPLLVEGQVHGGIAQGVAQALFEEVLYDEDGNPLTGSLMTYAIPSAAEMPSFDTLRTQTPTHMNPMGAKGIGESGTIGSTPAVLNAVVDAVVHLGVEHIDMPLTPERVWRAIDEARD